MRRALSLLSLVLSVGLAGTACENALVGQNPPLDRAVFPVGLAVHPSGRYLAVTSSNFDLQFNRGAFLLADLDVVDAALSSVSSPNEVAATVTDAFVAGALIPSFGNRPLFTNDGSRALLAARAGNRVLEIPIDTSGNRPQIECGSSEDDGTPVCGVAPFVLDMPANDPFDLILTSQSDNAWRGLVASLDDNNIFAFRFLGDRDGASRAQLLASSSLDLGEETLSVRSLALRTIGDDVVFAARERLQEESTTLQADLVWWVAADGRDARVRELSLTDDVGTLGVRTMAMTPDEDGLLILLRNPPALVRYDITGSGANTQVQFAGSTSTCDDPIRILTTRFEDGDGVNHDRALVTCFDDDSLLSYDATSLAELDAVRFFGRGPYDVATFGSRAYVSYFLDNSIGVFDLVDDDGQAHMVPRGRIGEPLVTAEDSSQ